MYQGTPQSPKRPAKEANERKNFSAHRGVRYVLARQAGPHTPGRRPPANLLTSWKFLFYSSKDFLSCAAATMGAASSSEVVAEKLREMGEGDAQRP
mgnify:CR=1 FL=1